MIVFAVVQLATVIAFVWFLRDRDQRERQERSDLLNRIQAPETAIALSLPEFDDAPLFESDDDFDRPQTQEIV